MGAILDILPRCIDKKDESGVLIIGVYPKQLGDVIGEDAFDKGGHLNMKFLQATIVGPYTRECQEA